MRGGSGSQTCAAVAVLTATVGQVFLFLQLVNQVKENGLWVQTNAGRLPRYAGRQYSAFGMVHSACMKKRLLKQVVAQNRFYCS